ncbi:MAG: hypothetical protein R3F34_18155 [Planctomycetota bacterium]
MDPAPAARTRANLVALLVFLVVAAIPLRDALLAPTSTCLLGADTATSQLPWREAIGERESSAETRVANDQISDQALVFLPAYRWLARSFAQGDLPLWNPLVFMGAPGLGNPQNGTLDPQVWFVLALDGLFGEGGFRAGLALVAWLRLGLGAFGAYLLAKRLGLLGAAPWIAGFGFGLCAFTVLWLNSPLGHVPPYLPWILLAIEGLRDRRDGALRACATFLAVVVLTASTVLAGHPETSFYCLALCGLWSLALLRDDRRAGVFALLGLGVGALLSAPALTTFLEYLDHSLAKEIRASQVPALGDADWLAVVACVVFAAGWLATRRSGGGARPWARSVSLIALVGFFAWRGLKESAVLAVAPAVFGRPEEIELGRYHGPGAYLEEASSFVPIALLVLAVASAVRGRGPLRRRGLVLGASAIAYALVLQVPGLLDLKRQLPLVGLGATVRLAPVAALGVALLAAEGWQSTGVRARLAGLVAVLAAGAIVALPPSAGEAPEVALEVAPAGVTLEKGPRERDSGRPIDLVVRVEGAAYDRVSAVFTTYDRAGAPRPETAVAISLDAAHEGGATRFESPYLDRSRLGTGWCVTELLLYEPGAAEPSERFVASVFLVQRHREWRGTTIVGLLLALVLPWARRGRLGPLVVAAIALRAVAFAEGQNPAVAGERVFPLSETERVLLEAPPGTRVFVDPGVLPPNTGMVRGIWTLQGYDAIEPKAYSQWQTLLLPPTAHRLLGWNARGVDPASSEFKLTGVTRLALSAPMEVSGWELVAAPDGSAERRAECFVYADTQPLPRAFVGPRTAALAEVAQLAAAGAWDPLEVASRPSGEGIAGPCTTSTVSAPRFTNDTVELEVELDGNGFLVLTEMNFPGWEASVDGGPFEQTVNATGVFRGLPLAAGAHTVRYVYRPASCEPGSPHRGRTRSAPARPRRPRARERWSGERHRSLIRRRARPTGRATTHTKPENGRPHQPSVFLRAPWCPRAARSAALRGLGAAGAVRGARRDLRTSRPSLLSLTWTDAASWAAASPRDSRRAD